MARKKQTSLKKSAGQRHVKKDTAVKRGPRNAGRRSLQASKRKAARTVQKTVQRRLTPAERGELKSALAIVRKHVKGYDTADGWTVANLSLLSTRRLATLKKKAREIRAVLNAPHDLVKVPVNREGKPNRKARRELYKFTHQKIRGAKHFIVHKPADNFSVRLDRGRIRISGTFAGKVSGKQRRQVVTETQFFLFDHTPDDEQNALRMLRDMLPEMPEGFYVVLTGQHGDTGEPVEKGQLLKRLQTYIHAYQTDSVAIYDREGKFVGRRETDTGFLQAITGFRHLSTSVEGLELQMQVRDARRRRQEDFNERLRKERLTPFERQQARDEARREGFRLKRKRAAKKSARTRKAKSKK